MVPYEMGGSIRGEDVWISAASLKNIQNKTRKRSMISKGEVGEMVVLV